MSNAEHWEFGYVTYGRGESYTVSETREEAEYQVADLDEKYSPALVVRRHVGKWLIA